MVASIRFVLPALLGAWFMAGPAGASDLTDSLKAGKPDLKSVGPLAFGPEGILFVGDPQGAALFAIDTGDKTAGPTGEFNVKGLDEKIAAVLGTEAKQILVHDMAVNPASGRAYFSVSRGKGPEANPVIVRVNRDEKVEALPLDDVKFAKATLGDAVESKTRREAITHIAFVNGKVFVAGLFNEDFASKLRAVPFPFADTDKGTAVEIFHGSHGKFETKSPVRTFVPFDIDGETNILAAYTCTPLVKIPVKQLQPGEKIQGVTVAELGNMNRPLDMIVYQKQGKSFILMANSSRGVMKISTDNIDKIEPITKQTKGRAGLTYDTVAALKGVQHLDVLDKEHALALVKTDAGSLNLETVELP